jgi:hypothetical protein
MYKCKTCNIEKDTSEFPVAKTRLGHKRECRTCYAEYMRGYYKRYPQQYDRHKKYVRKNDILYKVAYAKHHITEERFYELRDMYDGKCHACKDRSGTCIDHDHSCCTGPWSCGVCVRGILCNWCNSALGQMNDDIDQLNKLIDYLNR